MRTIRLPDGELSDVDTDCIVIQSKEGRFHVTGSALCGEESVSFGGATYDSFDEAVEAGVAWAKTQGVHTLYVGSVGPNDDLSPI